MTTAIRIGAVCNAPTWVRNAASSTIENGATRATRNGGEQAGERQTQRHRGQHLMHQDPDGSSDEQRREDRPADESARLAKAQGLPQWWRS